MLLLPLCKDGSPKVPGVTFLTRRSIFHSALESSSRAWSFLEEDSFTLFLAI